MRKNYGITRNANRQVFAGWLVGLAVSAGVYSALGRALDADRERAAIDDSEKTLRSLSRDAIS